MNFEHSEICPKCGADYFHAIPGKTTKEEVIGFLESIGEEASSPDLHPGAYCPKGCDTGYMASYVGDILCEGEGKILSLIHI